MKELKSDAVSIGKRCGWVTAEPIYLAYHDTEWGVVSRDDRHLFEMLVLEGAQAGLSWLTVLRKRDGYRRAFANFDPVRVVAFKPKDIEQLMQNEEIIRNRAKINATIELAKVVLQLQKEHGSLAEYLWSFAGNQVIQNRWKSYKEAPTTSSVSDAMSKALKGYGCKFVGSTILYSFMQAVGMVNDHETSCPRYKELKPAKG
jgi:DNA-3-methyladenine glycosylase I